MVNEQCREKAIEHLNDALNSVNSAWNSVTKSGIIYTMNFTMDIGNIEQALKSAIQKVKES
jgi:hypothetical protein